MVSSFPEKDRIDKSQLPELEVDLFLPCAQPYSIDHHNAGRVSARIISPGANAAITDQAEQILFQRGILSVPDFAANCGGVLGSSMKLTGLGDGYIRSFLEQNISRQMEWLTKLAEKENCPVAVSTRRIAMERFQAIKAAAERKDITSRITSYVLEIYRSGLIPPLLTAPLARWYFSKKLGAKVKEPSPSFSVCLPAQ